MKQYSWNINGLYKVDANDVGKEFEKLGDNLTPETVLNVARDENNVMHSMFEWNDEIAGEKYRKHQAAQMICSLRVEIIKDDKPTKKVRAFVTTKANTNYQPIEKVVSDTDRYQLLLDKAYRELNAIKLKYDSLSEIQELLADIPEIL